MRRNWIHLLLHARSQLDTPAGGRPVGNAFVSGAPAEMIPQLELALENTSIYKYLTTTDKVDLKNGKVFLSFSIFFLMAKLHMLKSQLDRENFSS